MPDASTFVMIPHTRYSRSLHQALTALRRQGAELGLCLTRSAEDTRTTALRLANAGARRLIVAGGDGTLGMVASSLLACERPPSLGVLPLGTANDFAAGQGLPLGRMREALQLALELPARPVDLGSVNGEAFVNVCNLGFVAEIARETPEWLKQLCGRQAYGFATLRKLFGMRTRRLRLRGPDFAWSGSFYALMVGNGRLAGGGFEICPGARLDDGLLNLTVVRRAPDWQRVPRVFETLLGEGVAALPEYVLIRRLPWLEVSLDTPLALEADGESLPAAATLRYQVLPRRLLMHLPLVGEPSLPLAADAALAP